MDNSGLIEALRALSRLEHDDLTIGDEAADEIERLTNSLHEKAEALYAQTNEVIELRRQRDELHRILIAREAIANVEGKCL